MFKYIILYDIHYMTDQPPRTFF